MTVKQLREHLNQFDESLPITFKVKTGQANEPYWLVNPNIKLDHLKVFDDDDELTLEFDRVLIMFEL